MPDLFQERGGIARRAECGVACFLVYQRLEVLREGVPQFLNIGQALLARGGGIANAEVPRQAAEVQQQVADGGANVKANRPKIAELSVDGLQAAVGHKNRTAVNVSVQQGFGVREKAVLEGGHGDFKLGVVAQGGNVVFQIGRVAVARVDLVRIVKEQIFGDLAHLRVDEFRYLRFFIVRMQIKIAGVEQGVSQIFPQLTRRLGVVNVVNQLAAPDAMAGEIFHHHHRQFRVKVVDFHRVLRAVLVMLDQGLRFKTGTIQRQRPGFADAAYIGQRLLNDDAAHARAVENFKDQVEVAVADFLRLYQR